MIDKFIFEQLKNACKDGAEKLYFVIETKGARDLTELHGSERAKIHCGEEHFKALGNSVFFPNKPVKEWREVKVNV